MPASSNSKIPSPLDSLFAPSGLAAAMPLAVIAWDARLCIVGWNAVAETLFGWTAEEALGADILELLVPESARRHVEDVLARVASGEIPVRSVNENRTKFGRTAVCEWQNTVLRGPDGKVTAVVGIARDVVAEGLAERRRERLQQIAAAANASLNLDDILLMIRNACIEVGGFDRAGVWIVDGDVVHGSWGTDTEGKLKDEHDVVERLVDWEPHVSDMASSQCGFCMHEWLSVDIPGLGVRDVPHAVMGLKSGGELVGLISVDNLISGRPVTAEAVTPLLAFAEEAASAIRNTKLIAERGRNLERQRRLSGLAAAISASTALSDILRMVRDAVVEVGGFDRASVYLYDREAQLLRGTWGTDREGRPEDQTGKESPVEKNSRIAGIRVVLGELAYAITPDFTSEYGIPPGAPMHGVRAHAVVPLRAGREIVGVICVDNLIRDVPISDEDIAGLLPFANQAGAAIQNARLFTELTRAQDALIRSERMRAVGDVAIGVGHNIGGVLMSVQGSAGFIKEAEDAVPEIRRYAEIIERAATDGKRILDRLLQTAGQDSSQPFFPFSVTESVQDAADLMQAAWQADEPKIEIRTELSGPLMVQGAASEIREVAISLLKNARESMPEGGTIIIRTLSGSCSAILEVEDAGAGMDDDTRARVFDQFFTTKRSGRGLGLGLSVAWGIVERHGGRIEVAKSSSAGSTFRVNLPLLADQRPSAPGDRAPHLDGLRVLVVEDEEDVAVVVARMLALRGAKPQIVTSGEEACRWLEKEHSQCGVVLTDHGMADMTGSELLAIVRDRWPKVRRVLLSGLGPQHSDVTDPIAEVVLGKPIRSNELAGALWKLVSPRETSR